MWLFDEYFKAFESLDAKLLRLLILADLHYPLAVSRQTILRAPGALPANVPFQNFLLRTDGFLTCVRPDMFRTCSGQYRFRPFGRAQGKVPEEFEGWGPKGGGASR